MYIIVSSNATHNLHQHTAVLLCNVSDEDLCKGETFQGVFKASSFKFCIGIPKVTNQLYTHKSQKSQFKVSERSVQ